MIARRHIERTISWVGNLITAVLVLLASNVHSQCANDNTAIAGAAITPTCPGVTNVPCVQGGRYALVNVVVGNIYTFAACSATFDTQITLYDNAGGASLGYNDDFCGLQSQVAWTATFSGQLRVLVDLYPCGNNTTCAPLTINCVAAPPAPANDNPCGATPLLVFPTCNYATGNNTNALPTTGPPAPTCGNYNGGDVWFSAVVPASGALIIETAAGTITDGAMALYTAPNCNGPFTQVACDDDAGPGLMPYLSFTGLAAGTTVYLRFWSYGNYTSGTFLLCLHTPPPPPAGDCVYVLNLFDSFGDGWGTSSVGVSVGGGPFTYYTVGGSAYQVLIGVNIGQVIVLNYNASGAFQFENSYTLGFNGGGVFFNSGSPPAAGISYTQTVSCQPPPAAPQDCSGGQTLCNSQSFNNNSSNTGNVVDLNTANQGCLSSGERQGTWYYFSPSASGTIGMTISPTVVTDYDFAIWGPLTGVQCPPAGAPTRCSYAAPTGNTGMGNGATDPSEGAGGDRWVSPLNVIAGQIYILYVDNFSSNGQSFSLSWQLSGGASLDCTVLAVGDLDLHATPKGSYMEVEWNTATERESSHFIIQRSSDGVTFEDVGRMEAVGNATTATHYSLNDHTARSGINYYRIVSVGMNSAQQFSPITSAILNGGSDILVVPNPVKGSAKVFLDVRTNGFVTMRITDTSGRQVRNSVIAVSEGQQQLEFRGSDLDAGTYFLQLFDAEGKVLGRAHFIHE